MVYNVVIYFFLGNVIIFFLWLVSLKEKKGWERKLSVVLSKIEKGD